MPAAIAIEDSTLQLGGRLIWRDLSLRVERGEFLTVIGPNGSGKTSLLKALLGLLPVTGRVEILGQPAHRGDRRIGYVPQQRGLEEVPLRGRDLVALGVDGDRWGMRLDRRSVENRVDAAIEAVGARAYADAPIGQLSGGEQQRLRIAQALAGDPQLLLCDEPLGSLDLHHQREIVDLINEWHHRERRSVVFVTHDVNPVLAATHRILAVVDGRWAAGTPEEVLTSETMTRLYGSPVDVLNVHGRVLVIAESLPVEGGHH
jgi:zinc/manganese transport system ATP-binding protein